MLSTKDKKEAVMQKFDKQAFIAEVKDNVKKLYRKNIEEADKQQIFQAVSYAVKDTIIDNSVSYTHLTLPTILQV